MNDRPLDATDLTWLARLARSLLGEADAADDLVQDTAMAAIAAALPPEPGRRAWLGSVARRLAARHHRSASRRARREREAAPPSALPDAAKLAARAEIAERLSAAARSLPEPFRTTILLRFLEGSSPEEIARRANRPVDTVRWRVRRGLELLRQELVRRHGRDWSSWCVLLAPLAHSGGNAGLATVGTSGLSAGWVASLITMKFLSVSVAAVLAVAGLLAWYASLPDPVSAPAAAQVAPPPIAAGRQHSDAAPSTVETAAGSERSAVAGRGSPPTPIAPASADELSGRVVDGNGDAVVGATVYLVPGAGSADDVRARVVSDARGAFRIEPPERDAPLDLGVAANGFLRRMLERAWPTQSGEELVLVLERGRRLVGVVLDEHDRPVPDLELLCHNLQASIQHVSPSQMELRSERARLGNAASSYQQCRGRTDRNGTVTFHGLPTDRLVLRSLDPSWTIDNPSVPAEDGGYVTWRATRRLGVRLTVVDRHTARPVELARATFRCELTFADGELVDVGQWVGRGNGIATFVLTPEELPALADRTVTRAVFYGTAGTADIRQDWRAEPIEGLRTASGVADVRVEIDAFANGGASDEPPPTAVLELDVRYADGAPFDHPLAVSWRARSDLGHRREDRARAQRMQSGRYRLELVAGDVDLQVADGAAAGSLPPWTGTMRCEADRTAVAFVTLPRGADVRITRPSGWQGDWFVHASWRPAATADWRGSWNYSTREDQLVLRALRPVEWRFALRRRSHEDPDPVIRTAMLGYGIETVVDR